jgi:DNA-directed RNA polymerase subunit delta
MADYGGKRRNMTDLKNLSLMEAAEQILSQNKNPMTFLELFKSLSEAKEMTDEEKSAIISQFYADFIVSAKFIYMGDDLWDLKYRQSIDLWDKDGAYYQEFPDFEEEEAEEEEAEFESSEEEEGEEEEEESEETFDEEEEEEYDEDESTDEEDEFDKVEDDVPAEEDAFDDDKYNEYMDDYEDMYDEE